MTSNFKRPELLFWTAMPACVTFLLFVLYIIPKHLWGIGYIMPILPIIPIFYWGKLDAPEMPYWFACLMGLFMDTASGIPLGLSSFLYLLFLVILHSQSKYLHKEGFAIVWGYFMILLAVIFILQWLIMSFTSNHLNAIPAVFMQWLITVCLYPLFHNIFDKIVEHVKQRRWILTHV